MLGNSLNIENTSNTSTENMYETVVKIIIATPQDGALSFSLSRLWMITLPTRETMTHPHRKKANLSLQVMQDLNVYSFFH